VYHHWLATNKNCCQLCDNCCIELEVNNDNTTIGISHVDPLPVHDVSVSIPVNNIKPTTTTTTTATL